MRGIILDFTMYYRVLVSKPAWHETKTNRSMKENTEPRNRPIVIAS